MEKKLKKLQLNKKTIANLCKDEMTNLQGGADTMPTACGPCPQVTVGKCDLKTIGHDDGPDCLSKTDWGICWCYGI